MQAIANAPHLKMKVQEVIFYAQYVASRLCPIETLLLLQFNSNARPCCC